nr:DUF6538 domain-containing protein [Agrobacterium sp. MA01]
MGETSKGNIGLFNPSYLVKSRCGVFYLRWPLPKQVHPQEKSTTLKLSLQTRDPREAQEFATQWLWTYNNERPDMSIGGITPAQKLKMAA